MTDYDVVAFADYDDFKTYVEAIATTTDISWQWTPDKGYVVVVG
jgi:hypothetical protein